MTWESAQEVMQNVFVCCLWMIISVHDNLGMFYSEYEPQFFLGKCVVIAIILSAIVFYHEIQPYFDRGRNLLRVFAINITDVLYPRKINIMLWVWRKFSDELEIYLLRCLVFPILIEYPKDFSRGPDRFTSHDEGSVVNVILWLSRFVLHKRIFIAGMKEEAWKFENI